MPLLRAQEILDLVPFSSSTRNSLRSLISSVANPILGDWTVVVHMTMLIIFGAHNYQIEDPIVQNINNQLWTMLRRHLTHTITSQFELDSTIAHVEHCLKALPRMLEWNKEVLSKFV